MRISRGRFLIISAAHLSH